LCIQITCALYDYLKLYEEITSNIPTNKDKFDKLITALRTATVDNDGTLATSYNDIFDAFRLALKFYHFQDISELDRTAVLVE
jgi:hypothetical protein